MRGADYEEEGRQRIRREESGRSTPEENQALEWLTTRLRTAPRPGERDYDWHVAASWNSSHWPKLKAALEAIPAQDHEAIDQAFKDYTRKNRLVIDVVPAPHPKALLEPPL